MNDTVQQKTEKVLSSQKVLAKSVFKKEDPDTVVINNLKDPRFVRHGETKYILQDRYLERGGAFSSWLFDRLDVGVLSGYSRFAPRGDREVDAGVPMGVYVKYHLNRLSALRGSYAYVAYGMEGSGKDIVHNGVDVDFMYNLSSFLYGHNAGRRLNVSAVVGGGYVNATFKGERNNVWKGQVGLNLDVKLTPSSHLFVEPYVSLVSDQADYSGGTNAHRWDVMYGVKAGLGLNFNQRRDSLARRGMDGGAGLFWEAGQGVTFFPSDDIGLTESVGTNWRASVGKWFDPYMGMRLSGVVRDFCWAKGTTESRRYGEFMVVPSYETRTRTLMCGGRLEVMLDVLNIFRGHEGRRDPVFAWQLSVGGEYGFMDKRIRNELENTSLKTYYAGVVVGSQFLCTAERGVAFYVEPQVLWANYSVPYRNAPDYKAKFTDAIYGVNVGLRLSRPEKGAGGASGGTAAVFVPRNFGGLMVGGLRRELMVVQKGDGKIPLSGGLVAGREFAPLVGAKVQVDCQLLPAAAMHTYRVDDGTVFSTPALFNETFTLLNAKVGYLLNFSNLYQGWRADRRMDLFLETGPSYVYVLKMRESLYSKEMAGGGHPVPLVSDGRGEGGAFAWWGGVMARVRLSEKLHLLVESWGQYLTDSQLLRGRGGKDRDVMMGVNVGVTYDF